MPLPWTCVIRLEFNVIPRQGMSLRPTCLMHAQHRTHIYIPWVVLWCIIQNDTRNWYIWVMFVYVYRTMTIFFELIDQKGHFKLSLVVENYAFTLHDCLWFKLHLLYWCHEFGVWPSMKIVCFKLIYTIQQMIVAILSIFVCTSTIQNVKVHRFGEPTNSKQYL